MRHTIDPSEIGPRRASKSCCWSLLASTARFKADRVVAPAAERGADQRRLGPSVY